MSYLKTAALCTTAGSLFGNFAVRRSDNAIFCAHFTFKTLLPSYSVGTSTKDPKNPDANIINLTHIEGCDPHGHNEKEIFKHTKLDFSAKKSDFLIIGICAVAPLLISGFLNPTLRNSNEFHSTLSFVGSAVLSFLMRLGREEPKDDATKNNKPKDNDDKPSKKKSEPPAITQLSEQDKRVLSEYKEPDSGRLSPVSKMYHDHLKNELNTTPNKAQLLKLKSKLDELAKKQEKETKENITKEINKAITTCNRLALERDYGVIETKYKECSELLKNAPEDIKRSSQDSMQQITRQLKEKITNDIYSSILLSPTQKPNIQTIISQLDIPTSIKTLNFARSIGVASSNYRGFNHQQKINYLDAKIQTVRSTPQSKLSVAKIHILELIKQNQNRINFTQHRQEHDFIGTNVQSFL